MVKIKHGWSLEGGADQVEKKILKERIRRNPQTLHQNKRLQIWKWTVTGRSKGPYLVQLQLQFA